MWTAKEKYGHETYMVANEITSPIGAEIIVYPNEGRLFEVEIWREHHTGVSDPNLGFYYEHNPETLESNEAPIITVEGVKEVLDRHGIDFPSDLAERLEKHEKAHLAAMREARLEYESEAHDLKQVPEFEKVGDSYFVKSARPGEWMSVTPKDGGFEVTVGREDSRDHWDGSTGEYIQAPEDETLHHSREVTIEDVRKVVEPFGITLPESLSKELEAGQRIGYTQDEYERQTDWAIEQSGNRMSGLVEEAWTKYNERDTAADNDNPFILARRRR